MLKNIICTILALAVVSLATTKQEVVKIIKPDTSITIKIDTIRTITYDTTLITKTFKDTAILIKSDTIKSKKKATK